MRPIATVAFFITSLLSVSAYAQNGIHYESYPGLRPIGNTLIRNESIEAVVRGMIARSLNADSSGGLLEFETPAYEQNLTLPDPNPGLKQIFDILGIQKELNFSVSPIKVKATLPVSTLKVSVIKQGTNQFEVTAGWQVSELKVATQMVSIKVPKGPFDQEFKIDSNRVTMGLEKKSAPIRLELKLLLNLTDDGTKIKVTSYRTNLNERNHPNFFVNLGPLTVGGVPLKLEIISNGQSLIADEPVIRDQFQKSEPQIVLALRKKVAKAIEDNVKAIASQIDAQPLLKFSMNTDEVLQNPDLDPKIKSLFGGVQMDLMFSYLQFIQDQNLFSAQIAGHFCVDTVCIMDQSRVSPIDRSDVTLMNANDDAGIILYESILQDLIHSDRFQARIRTYYNQIGATAGVNLSKSGVRVRFDPEQNAIGIIVNLDIDIQKTIKANTSFGERLKLTFGDMIEYYFGSGKTVKIPLEIKIKFTGVSQNNLGQTQLSATVSLPFTADGTYLAPRNCPPGWCQSNVASMTSMVKGSFMETVKHEFESLFPNYITIPINRDISVRDFSFTPKTFRISPNHGLLISGQLKDEGGKRK